ncbi:putative ATP-dependent RNA helicase ucp12, partial [Coemansia spiralis]
MGAKRKVKAGEPAASAAPAKGDKQPAPAAPEAAAQASIFGKWTGKTPVTLLNEYMQQMGWHRANYNVHSQGGLSSCTIVLSKEDKKLRQPVRVHFRPVATEAMAIQHPTALEARHAAATYALHRLRSNTNLHMLLPPAHRAYWVELETIRKSEPAEWMYAEDPFAAKAGREKHAEQKQVAHAKRQELYARAEKGHKEELLPPALRRRWDEMAEVHMSEQSRAAVELVVRTWTSNWDLVDSPVGQAPAGDGPASANRGTAGIASLVKLGFRKQHAEEALQYVSSREGAIDWLCVHVPEDDLPEQFLQRKYQSAAVIVAPQNGSDGGARHSLLSRQLTAKRLARSGFPTSICLATVEQALADLGTGRTGDLLEMAEACAASTLLCRLCGRDPPVLATARDETVCAAAVDDEVAALDAIFTGEDRVSRPSAFQVCFRLRPKDAKLCAGDAQLVLWLPPGLDYPEQPLAVTLASDEMPAYLKLHVARNLNAQLSSDGLPAMFEAVSVAEDQIEQWLAAPPPLLGLVDSVAHGPAAPAKGPAPRPPSKEPSRRQAGAGARDGTERLCREFAQLQLNAGYQKMQPERARLPAAAKRELVADLVSRNRCVVVSGATGCGKTTQIPQYILDTALARGEYVNIVCTQPRRISAIGVAGRVAEERAGALGGVVGYAVRGESKQGRDTRLLFCTTGVLLRMLVESKDLDHITHVVCDEVHERSVDSDMLLILLRQCQQRNRALKVVLMSATAQSSRFADYFGAGGSVPVVDIPGRTFPVDDVYVEDFARNISADELFGAAFARRALARLESARSRCADGDGKGIDEARALVAN